MAVVTVHSDFGAEENKICHCFHFPPSICLEVMGPDAMIFIFIMFQVSSQLFHCLISPSSRGSLVTFHFMRKGKIYPTECRVPENIKER